MECDFTIPTLTMLLNSATTCWIKGIWYGRGHTFLLELAWTIVQLVQDEGHGHHQIPKQCHLIFPLGGMWCFFQVTTPQALLLLQQKWNETSYFSACNPFIPFGVKRQKCVFKVSGSVYSYVVYHGIHQSPNRTKCWINRVNLMIILGSLSKIQWQYNLHT